MIKCYLIEQRGEERKGGEGERKGRGEKKTGQEGKGRWQDKRG